MNHSKPVFIMIMAVMSFTCWGVQPMVEKWVPVFNEPAADYMRSTAFGGNNLWYVSNKNNIGAISLLTNTIAHTSPFASFSNDIMSTFAAVNKDAAVFFLRDSFVTYRDGKLDSIKIPSGASNFTIEDDGVIRYLQNNKIITFNGSAWDTVKIPFKPDMTISENYDDFLYDSAGTLWIATSWIDGYNLYRIQDTKAIRIIRNRSTVFTLHKDHQGNLRIRNDNTIVTVKNDRLDTLLHLNSSTYTSHWTAFDPQGNIWYIESAPEGNNANNRLIKRSMAEPGSIQRYDLPVPDGYHLFSKGIIAVNPQGYYTMSFEDEKWKYISYRSLTGNSCGQHYLIGSSILHLFFETGGSFLIAGNQSVSHYSPSFCQDLPKAPATINDILKKADGTIYIGTGNGLYHLSSSVWMPDTSLKSINIKQLTVDKDQSIWGISGEIVFKQDGDYWQQITPGGNYDYNFRTCSFIGTDSNGTIWLLKGNTVHSTTSGKNWTTYDSGNSNLPGQQITHLFIDNKGSVHAYWAKTTADSTELFLASFNDTAWGIPKKIPFPAPGKFTFDKNFDMYSFVGSHDDFWIIFTNSFLTLCRYQDATWTFFDSTNAPFILAAIIGENREGEVYAFHSGTLPSALVKLIRTTTATESAPPQRHAVPFSVHSIEAGRCRVHYTVQKSGTVRISIFTPQGRLITTQESEHHQAGAFRQSIPINTSPGCYLVHLSTPEGSQVARVVLR